MTIEVVPSGTRIQDLGDPEVHVVTDENSVISGRHVYVTQANWDRCMGEIGKLLQPMADRLMADIAEMQKNWELYT